MIDLNLLRENPEVFEKGIKSKGLDLDISHILEIDSRYRELLQEVQRLREEKNREAIKRALELSREKHEITPDVIRRALEVSKSQQEDKSGAIRRALEIKEERKKEEHALSAVKEELDEWVYKIPNIPAPDVKEGKDETENEVIRKYKESTVLNFIPRDHLQIGDILDVIDVERAVKVSGARFAYLKNEAVLLEFALIRFAFDTLIRESFTPVIPPVLIGSDSMNKLGYLENGGREDMFYIEKDDMFLAGTAEHPVVSMHKNEVFNEKDLPRRYAAFSTCFRREAGSYGKDTKGILRVHQFDKVEMVSFVTKENGDREHEYLLSLEEKLFQMLDIPYQVVKMCTGDLGFPAARKYDIEAWMPGQGKYREVTSVSTVTDFQSRRLKIKYKEGEKTEYAYILNGTAFAIGRTIIAILENYQQEDGSVLVPEVLRKYTGFDKISPKQSS